MNAKQCDVLVAGGGVAGIAAALSAVRNGADVILLEKQCVLGGLATSGLVTVYLPLCDGRGMQVSYGIAEELLRLSILHGIQDKNPAAWLEASSTREERTRMRFEVQFNPVYFSLETERLLLNEGVKRFYDTRVCGVEMQGDKICDVAVENESGRQMIHCKAAVDATGTALLYRLAGESTRRHTVGNPVAGWYYASTKEGLRLKMLGYADFAEGSEKSGLRFAGDNAEDVNAYLYRSHQITLADLQKAEACNANFIEPALMTGMPQFRMIRSICGETVMHENADGKSVDSSVGMVSDWRKRGPRFEVPYGALYGKTENLFAAGRIVSCDDGMWDIMRVIPCCSVTGEAAGTAAAITSATDKRATTQQVQSALRQHGQKIHFSEI